MCRIYRNILHSFQGDFKILVKVMYLRRILWLISWSLQDDQGGITKTSPSLWQNMSHIGSASLRW